MRLEDVKPGNEVFLHLNDWDAPEKVEVQTVTKTQITVTWGESQKRYLKSSGREIGTRYFGTRIEPINPETEKRAARITEERLMKKRIRAANAAFEDLIVTDKNIDLVETFLKAVKEINP